MNANLSQRIVNKARSFAHVLRDNGLSHMAYTEQIEILDDLQSAMLQFAAVAAELASAPGDTSTADPG